jgi:hypothetical protein
MSLSEIILATENTDVDGDELHKLFIAAAEKGGDWVTYSWRNDLSALPTMKGAYVTKINKGGLPLYAGVGYSLIAPRNIADNIAEGLYGFVLTTEGRYLAHGVSTFVGKTLGEVIQLTQNDQIDQQALLQKFEEASSEEGGGWTTYPWRNCSLDPLRSKGAHVQKVDHPMHGRLYCCVGYFGERSQPWPSPPLPSAIMPTPEAAKVSAALLREQILLEESSAAEDQLLKLIHDHSGKIQTAALNAICWQSTTLPAELSKLLENHARNHLKHPVLGMVNQKTF